MPSLFSRLSRHAHNPLRDPGEERLTEAFATTLEAAPEATAELLRGLRLGTPPSDAPLAVTTQRRTAGGDRVDIELRYGATAAPELIIWLELKKDAPPDPDQMQRYAAALNALRCSSALALLTKRGVVVPDSTSGEHTNWQEVARLLGVWSRAAREESPESHATVLVVEFLSYLEEEELTRTEAFTVVDALALSNVGKASARLSEIVELARTEVGTRWASLVVDAETKNEWQARGKPLEFWKTYAIPEPQGGESAWPDTCWLEFNAGNDDVRLQPRDEGAFGAGASMMSVDAFTEETYGGWLTQLQALGFEYTTDGYKGEYTYLFRYLYPAELVAGIDLADQGRLLAEWVSRSFELLRDRPPVANA